MEPWAAALVALMEVAPMVVWTVAPRVVPLVALTEVAMVACAVARKVAPVEVVREECMVAMTADVAVDGLVARRGAMMGGMREAWREVVRVASEAKLRVVRWRNGPGRRHRSSM